MHACMSNFHINVLLCCLYMVIDLCVKNVITLQKRVLLCIMTGYLWQAFIVRLAFLLLSGVGARGHKGNIYFKLSVLSVIHVLQN